MYNTRNGLKVCLSPKGLSDRLDLGLEHDVGHQSENNNHGSQRDDVVPELITPHGNFL